MNWKFVIAATMIAIATSFAFACSDSDDDNNGDSDPEATEVLDGATEEPDANDAPNNGGSGLGSGGSATLTIGDNTYEFDNYYCAFGSDETQNARVSFSSGSFGESATGARTQLDVSIQDTNEGDATSGEGTIHSVSLNDIDNFEDPSVGWEAVTLFGADFEIQIDGKNISAETTFDDATTEEFPPEEIPGTFAGTCP